MRKRLKTNLVLALLISSLFAFAPSTFATPLAPAKAVKEISLLDPAYVEFIKAEQGNDYLANDTTVSADYQAKGLKPFTVKYIEVPRERLNVEIAFEDSQIVRDHLLVNRDGKAFVRFYIHPESEHLYQPLMNEFGVRGEYIALATASTRSVLAWDPSRRNLKPIFLKLSLAQFQDQMGRIIPGWEVRRSVRVTELVQGDKLAGVQQERASIIPEVAGVYTKKSEKLGFKVDADQGDVFEHGYILRDASFIEESHGKKVVPLFWLFSKQGNRAPPVIKLWKKSGLPFEEFIRGYLFEPFMRDNLPMMVRQGIVPQIHGQNVILVLDPKTLAIEHTYHRDIGSMKTDYRLRWIGGLPITSLRSDLADKDFGLSWGAEKIPEYFRSYFHDWVFIWGYKDNMQTYVEGFDSRKTLDQMYAALKAELQRAMNLPSLPLRANDAVKDYLKNSSPKISESNEAEFSNEEALKFVKGREFKEQTAAFPKAWANQASEAANKVLELRGWLATDYGIIYSPQKLGLNQTSDLRIAFYSLPPRAAPKRKFTPKTCHAIFN